MSYRSLAVASTKVVRLVGPVVMAVFLVATALAGGNRDKARHFYLLGSASEAAQNYAAAHEYYQRAYECDTTYPEAALSYGHMRYGMNTDTLATETERLRSLEIMSKYIDAYPGDFFASYLYSEGAMRMGLNDKAIAALEAVRLKHPENTDILPVLSNAYLDSKLYDQALKAVDDYIRAEGEDIKLNLRKAAIRIAMGDTVGALAEADAMTAEHPDDAQYWVMKGQLEEYLGHKENALTSYIKADSLSGASEGGSVKIQLANYYKNQGDSVHYDAAVYSALLAEDLAFEVKHDLLAYYLQGLVIDKSDYARGDRIFNVLLGQFPHEPALLILSSKYNVAKGDYARAQEDAGYAIDMDPQDPEYRRQAMVCAVMDDKPQQAVDIFEQSVNKITDLPLELYELGATAASISGDYAKSLAILNDGVTKYFPGQSIDSPLAMKQLGPYLTFDNISVLASIYTTAGDVHYKQKDREKAFANYKSALELTPDNPLTLNNYAYFLIEEDGELPAEELAEADRMSGEAMKLSPDNPTYMDTRAWVLYRKGDYERAKEILEAAMKIAVDNDTDPKAMAEFYNHMGDIEFKLGNAEAALEWWKKAYKADNSNESVGRKIKMKHL